MISPELGTAPRCDTTGVGKYLTTELLGMQKALSTGGQADPWNGLKFRYDFPEEKFPVLGYELYAGLRPDFIKPNDPALPPGPDNDYWWGLAQVAMAPPGDIAATFTSIVNIAGLLGQLYALEPDKQIYVKVRPMFDTGPGAWSEGLSAFTAHKPTAGQYPTIDPAPVHPFEREVGFVPPLIEHVIGVFTTIPETYNPLGFEVQFNGDTARWSVEIGGVLNGPLVGSAPRFEDVPAGTECIIRVSDPSDVSEFYNETNYVAGELPDLKGMSGLSLTRFRGNLVLTGGISDLSNKPLLQTYTCGINRLTGSIPDLSGSPALSLFSCETNLITGSIPDLSGNPNLTDFYCGKNDLTGSIPDLSNNPKMNFFECQNNRLTDFTGRIASMIEFNASLNALTEEAVNNLLVAFDTMGGMGTGTIKLFGGTNAAPTGDGSTAKANLEAKGWDVQTN